jgi:hypothetical protein
MAQDLGQSSILQLPVLLHFGHIAFSQPDHKVSGITHINMKGCIIYQHSLLRLFTSTKIDKKTNKATQKKETFA